MAAPAQGCRPSEQSLNPGPRAAFLRNGQGSSRGGPPRAEMVLALEEAKEKGEGDREGDHTIVVGHRAPGTRPGLVSTSQPARGRVLSHVLTERPVDRGAEV